MIRNIHLYGQMADKFTKEPIPLEVDNLHVLISGIDSAYPGSRQFLRECENFNVLVKRNGELKSVNKDSINMSFGDTVTDVYIVPRVEGDGAEVALYFGLTGLAAAVVAFAVNIAITMVVQSLIQSLSPTPKLGGANGGSAERPEERPSFLFNGPLNQSEEGNAVPLVYGRFRTGSVRISIGVATEEI